MSASINKVILLGNLTDEPDLKQTPGGLSVCNFTIAVSRKFAKQGEQSADFIKICAWRSSADFVGKYLHKGSSVLVCGQIQTRNYTNAQGQKVYITEVLAEDVQSVGNKSDNSGNVSVPHSNGYTPTAYGGNSSGFSPIEVGEESSLPF